MSQPIPLNQQIRSAIGARGESISSTARAAGVSRQTLTTWLKEDGQIPSIRHLQRVSNALNASFTIYPDSPAPTSPAPPSPASDSPALSAASPAESASSEAGQ